MAGSDKPYSNDLINRRTLLAGGAGAAVWAVLAGRLGYLQLTEAERYEEFALRNEVSLVPTPARRGLILDRFGTRLATHRQSWNVAITREGAGDIDSVLSRIRSEIEISDVDAERIREELKFSEAFIPIEVAADLTYEQFTRLSVVRHKLPGVRIEAAEARSYPMGRTFAHVLGYVARANARDIERLTDDLDSATAQSFRRILKHPNMRVGRLGVERQADVWLRGSYGNRRFIKNAAGRIIRVLEDDETAPREGQDVWLTVDAALQQVAMDRFGEGTGAAVVIDIRNGDVLALVSTPTYEPNDFVNGISSTDYNALRDDERSPLYHKAYDGVYPPGSTFKMLVAAAALEAGTMGPDDHVFCGGSIPFGNRRFHCWKRGGHGSMNLQGAIANSCDVYFYEAARRTGAEKLSAESHKFGLGERFELGLTGGASGTVPNDAWKRATLGQPWYQGETLNFGIGQGYLTSSPLQLAVMVARIAAGTGSQVVPRLIGQGPDGLQSPAPPPLDTSKEIMSKI